MSAGKKGTHMRRWLLTIGVAALCLVPLHADVTIVQTMTVEGPMAGAIGGTLPTMTMRIKGNKARADVVRRFMKAYTEGIRYYKSQKEVAVRKTMEKLRTNDRAIGEFDYNQRVRALPDDAKPTIKGMQLALDDIAKDNPKAKNLTISQLVDLSFLP